MKYCLAFGTLARMRALGSFGTRQFVHSWCQQQHHVYARHIVPLPACASSNHSQHPLSISFMVHAHNSLASAQRLDLEITRMYKDLTILLPRHLRFPLSFPFSVYLIPTAYSSSLPLPLIRLLILFFRYPSRLSFLFASL